jgi:thymidylate kinase
MIERIIVEGADQQGKSTLCKLLAEQLGWKVKHYGKPSPDFDYVRDYLVPPKTICDRSFPSEIVYSRVNDVKSRCSINLLSNIMRHQNCLLIILDRNSDFVFDSSRHEDYTESQITRALVLYRALFKQIDMQKVIINPNDILHETYINNLIKGIKDGSL